MKNNPGAMNTKGILFDKEGSQITDNSVPFSKYSNYVHSLGGVVYPNPGYNYKYVINYLTGSTTGGIPDVDIANIHEAGPSRIFQMSVPAGISPDHLSAIVKSENKCSGMVSDIPDVSSKGIANVYVTGSTYSSSSSYFSNEAYYIENNASNC
jgi:hypothetical protein